VEKVRYLNKSINDNERNLISHYWKEQIEHYGVEITYYVNGYSLINHNFLYGEDPTATFLSSGPVVMMTDITNDAIMLSKFGIQADCDMTAVIHISSFYETFGACREPKSGDLIEMKEYGGFGDRPGRRGAPIYEITERDDQNLQFNANKLMGHYIWVIKCKRWEYSSEPGVLAEPRNKQVNDSEMYGRMPGGENPSELAMPYPDSTDEHAKCVFDHDGIDLSKDYGYYGGFEGIPVVNPNNEPCKDLTDDMILANPQNFEQMMKFYEDNAQDIVLRRTLSSEPGNIDTFMLMTSGKPEDVIVYTSNKDKVTLSDIGADGVQDDIDNVVDAGFF
jgi:hypothetical protein